MRALAALEAARPELRERWAGAVEAPAEGRERRGARGRGPRAGGDPGRARGRPDAALPRRPRPARGHHGGGDAGRELRARRTSPRPRRRSSAWPRTPATPRPRAGGRSPRRSGAIAVRALPLAARAADVRPGSQPVALEAIRSAGRGGGPEDLLVPALVSLLRYRSLQAAAREVLAARGDDVLEALGHFLTDAAEDVEVRRRIPAVLARIPSQSVGGPAARRPGAGGRSRSRPGAGRAGAAAARASPRSSSRARRSRRGASRRRGGPCAPRACASTSCATTAKARCSIARSRSGGSDRRTASTGCSP